MNYFDRSDIKSFLPATIKYCLLGGNDVSDYNVDISATPSKNTQKSLRDCFLLAYCFFGLMISYLTWGVLQEKIMTREYVDSEGKKSYFKDSEFLVFSNRVLAFMISAVYLFTKNHIYQRAPLYSFSYASISNIMSAWFQYEALKFVNFPTQVLAKSCKIIPVMIMGKVISKTKYELHEYVTAVMISIGMVFFLTGSEDNAKGNKTYK